MNNTLQKIMEQSNSSEAGKILQDWMRETARNAFYAIVEEEINELCGPKYAPVKGSNYQRAGSTQSSIYVEGKKESAIRPRVRVKREIKLLNSN